MKGPRSKRNAPAVGDTAGLGPSADGQLVYVVGDIHGRYDLLIELLRRLVRDSRLRAFGRRPILIFCGDYVDRGPDSAKVVEAVLQLRQHEEFDVRLLKGNHEQAMLDFLSEPLEASAWLNFGGAETLASYGVALEEEEPSDTDLIIARDRLLERMPAAHLHLLHQLELMFVVGDYAVVHAGVRPGVDLDNQAEQDLLWIREAFINHEGAFPKVVVHGHTWTGDQPQLEPYRIGVDTGAYRTGVLTAVRLDGQNVAFVQSSDPEPDTPLTYIT